MSDLLRLRDYQSACIKAIHSRWDAGVNRIASVLPTGAGKTVIFAHLAEQYLTLNPGKRVLVLAHTDELVNQAALKMRKVAPHRSVGIVKAALNQATASVVVASVQSLRTVARRNGIRNVGLIICDEVHHVVASTYRAILEHFGVMDGKTLFAGFTATLVRSDKSKLSEVIQEVAFKRDISFMIRHGYLLDLKGYRIQVPDLDLSDVKRSGGDYQDASLADALVEAYAPEIIAKAYVDRAGERRGIVFVPNVASAYVFCAAFMDQGIPTEVVHGGLKRDERRGVLQRLAVGDTQVVVNCQVLTEGFDDPGVSCVVVARPTQSSGLYVQMIGRALRPDLALRPEERGHALILDVVGASALHNLASLVDLSLPDDPYEKEEREPCFTCDQVPCECPKEETEPDFAPEEYYAGPVEVVDFDPLARDSSHAWQRTAGGTYVLTAGPSAYVFLVEEEMPGEYGIAWCTQDLSVYGFLGCVEGEPYFKKGPRCTCVGPARPGEHGVHNGAWGAWANGHRNLSMEMALAWGVDVAEELGGDTAVMFGSKKKTWRKSKEISAGQLWQARKVGVTVPMMKKDGAMVPDIRKGELSDLIDQAMATKRVDPVRAALRAQVKEAVNA